MDFPPIIGVFAKPEVKPEIDSFVKIFPGVAHGCSVRYKDEDEVAVKSANEAHKDLLHWFIKHLN